MLIDPVLKLEAAFSAEPEVDERPVDRLGLEELSGVAERGGGVDGVTVAGEPGDHGPPDSSLVVDIENGRHAIPSPSEPRPTHRKCHVTAAAYAAISEDVPRHG